MKIGIGKQRLKDAEEEIGPGLGVARRADQVLPDLDQRVGEPLRVPWVWSVSPRSAPS